MHTTLISAQQLQALQASCQDWLLFDCSFDLMNPAAGGIQYLEAHLPGARRADLDQHLSGHDPAHNASGGRHPLPERGRFAAWLQTQGLNPGTQVVVYDRQGVNYCGRLWWMLKWCGFDSVAVLDGGLAAWQAMGGELVSGPAPGPVKPGGFKPGAPLANTWQTTDIVSAIPNLLAMELAGLGRSALYPGSWSEWCRTPGMPVARS